MGKFALHMKADAKYGQNAHLSEAYQARLNAGRRAGIPNVSVRLDNQKLGRHRPKDPYEQTAVLTEQATQEQESFMARSGGDWTQGVKSKPGPMLSSGQVQIDGPNYGNKNSPELAQALAHAKDPSLSGTERTGWAQQAAAIFMDLAGGFGLFGPKSA